MLFKRIKTSGFFQLLLRYLAEVIIIFLGITISFVFEQWREGQRQKKELIELSESLLSDIGSLKDKLKEDLSGSANWIRQLDSLRIQRTTGILSDKQLTWFYKMVTGQYVFLFDPYSPTYMSAAGSGLLNELPDSIRNQLYRLYRIELPFFQVLYDQQQDNITNFRNRIMVPSQVYLYETESLGIAPDFKVLRETFRQPAYGNFVNQVIVTEQKVVEMNEDAFGALSELESSLKEYILREKQ